MTSERPATVAVVEYAGAQTAAALGLVDLMSAAGRLDAQRTGRTRLVAHHLRDALEAPDPPLTALVLPPSLGESPPESVPAPLARWIRDRYAEGTTLCSVCVGAFLLAELGLLDGRPATTHWALGDVFRARFPQVDLQTQALIVDDGDIVTAGGLMAWTDLGLRLIGRYLGPAAMLETSRFFLVDPGGREQRFYEQFVPVLTHGDEAILRTQRLLQASIGTSISVDEMAAHAKLGRRTFLRRFQRATGLKTSAYVQQLAVSRARERLERTNETVSEIAYAVGYEDPGAFRRMFAHWMGLSPGEYRRRFGLDAPPSPDLG